ncbi:MAG TPA: type II CAAX endopeptidase family protein [Acidobacteriota bacterium]|nr:type II CAAX endopeptidase family protein [Acidobacteriota bacterium]
MTPPRPGRDVRLVGGIGALAAILFIALFRFRRIGPVDFWTWLAANIVIVTGLAFVADKGYRARLREDLRSGLIMKVTIGLASAGALYAVFAAGRAAALLIFPFAASGIRQVYALKAGASVLRIALLLGLVIGPGEELFWRGFLQEKAGGTTRPGIGFALTVMLYTAVHLASGNMMLVIAAGVCAVFWGWLYFAFRSPVMNIVSHTLWDLLVFVFLPF